MSRRIVITGGGSGYDGPVTVTISNEDSNKNGVRAVARAEISEGNVVTAVRIVNPGIGYTENPTVTIADPPAISGIGTYQFNELITGESWVAPTGGYTAPEGWSEVFYESVPNYLTPLTDTKGNAWSSAIPIGVNKTLTGYNLITETSGKKGSTFSEYMVSSDGEVSKKGSKLTSLQLVGEEVNYSADLNQDGSIGLLPAGDRSDYGSGATKVYEISGVGHGILADGADYLTPLTDTKGNAWRAATPIGVDATGAVFFPLQEPDVARRV